MLLHPSHVRMTGPLAPHQDVIWTDLLSRGYTRLSARNVLRLAAHLSRWLQVNGRSPQDLTRDRIGEFLGHRRACDYTCWLSPRGLEPILLVLRAQSVVPPAEPVAEEDSPLARLLLRISVEVEGSFRSKWRADIGASGRGVSGMWHCHSGASDTPRDLRSASGAG